jgi:hypothetical protein
MGKAEPVSNTYIFFDLSRGIEQSTDLFDLPFLSLNENSTQSINADGNHETTQGDQSHSSLLGAQVRHFMYDLDQM